MQTVLQHVMLAAGFHIWQCEAPMMRMTIPSTDTTCMLLLRDSQAVCP